MGETAFKRREVVIYTCQVKSAGLIDCEGKGCDEMGWERGDIETKAFQQAATEDDDFCTCEEVLVHGDKERDGRSQKWKVAHRITAS